MRGRPFVAIAAPAFRMLGVHGPCSRRGFAGGRLAFCLLAWCLGPSPSIWAQDTAQGTLTGRVVNGITQEPLNLARVHIPGLDIGALTNEEGSYELRNVPVGSHTLVAEVIGYQAVSEEVTITAGATVTMSFELVQAAVALDELVVVGYGTQTRATLSGAVSAIDAEAVSRTSATTTTEALVGKMAGLTTRMTNSDIGDARPGSSNIVQIRNLGRPLVVIDGIPQEYIETSGQGALGGNSRGYDRHGEEFLNPLDNINFDDIESISILKDASASVYGFRGADGVILITTKQGRADQPAQISVDGYYGWQNFTRFPFNPHATAYEFQRAWVQSEQNLGDQRTISAEELEKWRIGAEPGYQSFNQYDVVINNPNAAQYQANASISGGAENATYYISLGHRNQDYLMRGHNFDITTFRTNLRAQLTDSWAIGARVGAGLENRNNVAIPGRENVVFNATLGINSSWPMDNPWANGNRDFVNGDVRFLERLGSTYERDIAGWQEDVRRNLDSSFFTEYTFPFGLELRGTYSHTFRLNTFERHRFNYDAYCYDEATDIYEVCAGFQGAQRDKDRREFVQQVAQIEASHQQQFGAHTISGVAGFEVMGSEQDFFTIAAVPSTNFNKLIDLVNANALDDGWLRTARQSFIGRVNYDYDQKYLVEAFGRYDASYLYAPGNRWGFFPGISVAWRPTEEAFLEDRFGFLDELKFRASWGQTGREQGAQPWAFLEGATYGAGGGYMFDGEVVTGVRPRGLPVTNLSWVTSTAKNLGVDFVVFGNKLSGEFDVFERKLTGLPEARYDVLLPSEVGYELPDENLESEATLGFEGMLTYMDQVGPISFSVSPHATVARRKILDRYRPRYGNSWDQYRNGSEDRWTGVFFGYQSEGQFQSVEEIENHPVDIDGQGNRTLLPGDIKWTDTNGDGIINGLDVRPVGYATDNNPILMFGLNSSLSYGPVTLAIDFSGGAMYSWQRAVESKLPFQGNHNSQQWLLADVWHRADPYDDQSEWVPGRYPAIRRGWTDHSNMARQGSDFWRVNVKYLRLRRVQLTYEVPGGLISGFGMDRLSLYASLANPFSIDNMHEYNMDPEMFAAAAMMYPTQRVLNVGFRTGF